jgi:hypothetical protein
VNKSDPNGHIAFVVPGIVWAAEACASGICGAIAGIIAGTSLGVAIFGNSLANEQTGTVSNMANKGGIYTGPGGDE